mmetsp:Transcript_42572/g.68371  ORF Transcript_42572/g.68371 Transcript_42572/m.68371 type:complete len:303 (-) Transcript_42572:144-1052(-)|eukprot:CAMPEP_0197056416 /NCGR_PEP_ID=MMETSP1384-20130603/84274_1 /TAXON_ID=29189 /ORGANISM="Ammonia sp." /LENGTH=302 /DNA_ID=CAMNT_0042490399 /DNA_START=48 /DNA_END=956 /DNA_ORIENTATION=+
MKARSLSLHGCLSKLNKVCSVQSTGSRAFSTAFDPWHYLHYDTARRDQANSFRKVWQNDVGDFKRSLSAEEIQQFEEKLAGSEGFDQFYKKMQDLFSPRRHEAIRRSRTWDFTSNQLLRFQQSDHNALSKIVFDTDDVFVDEFQTKYLLYPQHDINGLLVDFDLCDLRLMCALQAIDMYGGPAIMPVFGCRKNYHFAIPDPTQHTAHWLTCMHGDKHTLYDLVLVTSITAIKENKKINQLWFRDKLESLQPNALKEEEFREYAQEFSLMDTETFNDKLERAFVAFQTDAGVSQVEPVFKTDI